MSSEASIVGYCRTCGKALEDTAGATEDGVLYCSEHVPAAPAAATPYSAPPFHAPGSPYAAASPYTASSPYTSSSSYPPGQPPPLPNSQSHVSPGLAFILGMIPGVGAVYNGQYAKGLVHVVILGVLISILANDAAHGFEAVFGLLIACFFFYMAFEAYHTAKKRRQGELVEEFSGLASFRGRRSRFPAAPILLIAFGVLFLLDNLDLLKIGKLVRYWPALLIMLGLYMLYERITEGSDGRQ